MTATRAYVRLVAFIAAGTFSAGAAGLPGIPGWLLGTVLGLAAACVRWRNVWLRLQVACLRVFAGRDLVYLAADYGPPDKPEVPVPVMRPDLGPWGSRCPCRLCDEQLINDLRATEVERLKVLRDGLREVSGAVRVERARAADAEAAAQYTSRLIAELQSDIRRTELRRPYLERHGGR